MSTEERCDIPVASEAQSTEEHLPTQEASSPPVSEESKQSLKRHTSDDSHTTVALEVMASAHNVQPSTPAASDIHESARTPPRSGQGTVSQQNEQQSSDPTVEDVKNNHVADVLQSIEHIDRPLGAEISGAATLADPEESMDAFDWSSLEGRYHDAVRQCAANESEIFCEFNSLCDYFGVWASAVSKREVDRSFKRLKTQETYVQHEETDLEQKRQHYIKVVDAFRSALQLLGKQ